MKKIILFGALILLFAGVFFYIDKTKQAEKVDVDDATHIEAPDLKEDAEAGEDVDGEVEGTDTEDPAEEPDEEAVDVEKDSLAEGTEDDQKGDSTETTPAPQSTKGSVVGTYVGLVDSRTIEVTVNGTANIFSYDMSMQETVYGLSEQSKVEIAYKENGSGEKVITSIQAK